MPGDLLGKRESLERSKRSLFTESIGRKFELKSVGQKQQFIHVLQT